MTTPARPPSAPPNSAGSLRLVGWLAASWALLLVVGFLMLRNPNALGARNPVSGSRAVFLSVSTGATASFVMDFARPDDFAGPVRAVLVLQTLSGILLSLVGGGVLLARLLGRSYTDGQVTATALVMMAVAFAIGTLTAKTELSTQAGLRGVWALGCGGVLFGDTPKPGPAFSLALVPLSIVGSFGVVVIRDIAAAVRGRTPWPEHAWRVIALTAGVYVAAMALLTFASPPPDKAWAAGVLRNDSLFWAAHALGLPVRFASSWSPNVTWPLLGVMFIGVGTAGSAGAIGLGWLATMPSRFRPLVINALTAAALLAAVTLGALAWVEPALRPVQRSLLVASAMMNLGLSHEPLSITGPALYVLAGCVAVAKVLPLGVLAYAVRQKAAA